MSPDPSTLLDELTGARPSSAETLVRALRLDRHRTAKRRALATAGAGVLGLAWAFAFLAHDLPKPTVSIPPVPSQQLTPAELLDAFGDQPVALVTWPDGRQQLLAIASRPYHGRARQ